MSPCFSASRKAQGALEFTLMFSVVIFLFIALFTYIGGQFAIISQNSLQSVDLAVANELQQAITQAHRAQAGYTIGINLPLQTTSGSQIVFVKNTRGYVTEIEIKGEESSQVLFLPERLWFLESACDGNNEIYKAPDGVGLCCNSCNSLLPGQSQDGLLCAKLYDDLMGPLQDCDQELSDGDLFGEIRVKCEFPGYTNVTFWDRQDITADILANFTISELQEDQPYFYADINASWGVNNSNEYFEVPNLNIQPNVLFNITYECFQQIGFDRFNQTNASGIVFPT